MHIELNKYFTAVTIASLALIGFAIGVALAAPSGGKSTENLVQIDVGTEQAGLGSLPEPPSPAPRNSGTAHTTTSHLPAMHPTEAADTSHEQPSAPTTVNVEASKSSVAVPVPQMPPQQVSIPPHLSAEAPAPRPAPAENPRNYPPIPPPAFRVDDGAVTFN